MIARIGPIAAAVFLTAAAATAQEDRPNILVIMGRRCRLVQHQRL